MEPDNRQTASPPQFEEIYPLYDFAPLVALALTTAAWLKRHLEKKPQSTRPGKTQPLAGMKPSAR